MERHSHEGQAAALKLLSMFSIGQRIKHSGVILDGMSVQSLGNGLWLIWFAAWMAASVNVKHNRLTDRMLPRLVYSLIVALAYFLLFYRHLQLGVLDYRFLTAAVAVQLFGLFLTAVGLGFSVWARIHLGRNWSSAVRIGQGHELIRSGPYARIRHPIYSGILLATAGTVFVNGGYRDLLALPFAFLGFAYKAMREERMLGREFGPAFEEHRRRTGFLTPKLNTDIDPS